MKTKELTRISFMAAILACVFQLCSNVIYFECITFTIVVFSCTFPQKDVILACVIFALLNMIFLGITPWTLMYLLIYPLYARGLTGKKEYFLQHPFTLYCLCGCLSFLTGQLLDLPYLLFSGRITLLYMIMGLRTSVIQGIISFLLCMFLFDPLMRQMKKILI